MTGPEDPAAAGRDRLRAGHADREQVIEALKDAFVYGRLTRDELDVRAGRALAARTRAELAALTADIPGDPAAAGPSRPSAPAPVRGPLARAAAGSGSCLVIAAAAVQVAFLVDTDGPAPNPHQSWVPWCLTVAFFAVLTALGIVIHGVETAAEQRGSRKRQGETQTVVPMKAPPVRPPPNAASQTQGARIIKKILTKLSKTAKG